MSLLAKLEQACAALIERSFRERVPDRSGTRADRAEIRRDRWRLAPSTKAANASRPSRYTVIVNPDDFERLAPHREYLEREWAELLRELSARVGIMLRDGDPKVVMTARTACRWVRWTCGSTTAAA